MNRPVAGRTTVRHRPTGRTFVVDNVSTTTASLSGIMGGRRLVRLEDLQNAEVWEVVTHG